MSKRLCFFISLVLVLSLGGLAQADAIDVNNFSFELGSDGNQLTCGAGSDDVFAWEPGGGGYVGMNIDCCSPAIDVNCLAAEDCWDVNTAITGGQMPDGYAHLYFEVGAYIYQILDMNNSDANAVIEAGRKYTLEWDGLGWDDSITATLFYGNNPDANEIVSTTQSLVQSGATPWDYFPGKLIFVAEPGQDCLGETLGLKFTPGGDGYVFIDNVRLEWSWSSNAYDPDPADEAEDVPMDVNLAWSPGLWAVGDVNGHEVYFGTSWADVDSATTATTGIYRGSGVGVVSGPDGNDRYSYDVLEILELGKSYYWRIDEVNESWVSGPVPPVNDRWKGDVWSFRTTGLAYNVYPADGAGDIPSLNLTLYWEAGTGAGSHDVYFGTSQADVEDANTSNTAMYPGVFRGNQLDVNDPNYPVEDLEVGENYFWKIDEVNTGTGTFVQGDVWSFTTGVFLIVDSFEPHRYKDTVDLRDTWKDWFATGGLNDALVQLYFTKTDANKVIEEQSMEFAYRNKNKSGADFVGAEISASTADLEIGTDWTIAGVKALMVNFYGDPCNAEEGRYLTSYDILNDQMYVALEDGSTNVGIVKLPNMTDIKGASWHTWNISLLDPCFSSVDMNNVVKVYIGFGGTDKTGQSKGGAGTKSGKYDTVWFDDIRLYPPRCMPSVTGLDVLRSLGDIGGGGEDGTAQDCNTNYLDLDIMARDWASIDGLAMTENRPATLTGYPDTTSHWTTDRAVGTGAIDANKGWNIDIDDPRLNGLTSMSITCWVNPDAGSREYQSMVSSREDVGCGDDATELGVYQNEVGYDWSCGSEEWQWSSKLVVPTDSNWTFIAIVVDPNEANAYMKTASGALQTSKHEQTHAVQQNFSQGFTIGNNDKEERDYFRGKMDDVRIYGYNLDFNDVNNLAYQAGEPNPPPVYWYKFDDGSGLSAADSGTPIEVYSTNMSPANLLPKDPCESEDPNLASGAFDPNNMDIVNFVDYRVIAEHWLEQHPWP